MKRSIFFLVIAMYSFCTLGFSQKTVYNKDSTMTVYTKNSIDFNTKIEKFSKNGKLIETGQYNLDGKLGTWINYHQNGKINTVASFKNNNKIGNWKMYDDSGNLIMLLTYKRNKLIGGVKWDSDGLIHLAYN